MKKLIIAALLGVSALVASVWAQGVAGKSQVSMIWSPYTAPATGFRLYFGYATNPPGTYFTNYTVLGSNTTSFVFISEPGVAYRSAMMAYSEEDGRISQMTSDVVWTNPPQFMPSVTGYRPLTIIYAPKN